ncbi:MAG: protein kinase [Lentisphaeraceae bacterium]|nr:protein kinase [Lentisphaeraceae bacterium]
MRFQCNHCHGLVAIDDSELGQHVGCGHCDEVVQVPDSKFSPHSVIDDFVIERMLGRGGMGIVYKAHQMSLDRPVALKVLMNQYTNDNDFVIDFIREARAAARLNHPYIVQAYAVGQDDDTYFLAMEYVEGQTMKQIMDVDKSLSLEFSLNATAQVAEALGFAWTEQQLIHRDIKPDNIMITGDNVAKLMDLGLSRFANDKLADTEDEDEVMGTPQYICPEQLIGMPMDVRGDLYSLGATLYHAITGEFPFNGRNAAEIAKKHLQDPLVPANVHNPSIPPSVCKLVEKMMAKHPDDRHANTAELIKDINKIKASLTSSKRTPKSKSQPIKIKAGGNKSKTNGPSTTSKHNVAGKTGSFNKAGRTGSFSKAGKTGSFNKTGRTGSLNKTKSAGSSSKNNTVTRNTKRTTSKRNIEELESGPGKRGSKSKKQDTKYSGKANPALLYGTIGAVVLFLIVAVVAAISK